MEKKGPRKKTLNGVEYIILYEELKVGDNYYSPFMGGVNEYLDSDYGEFDPVSMGFPKIITMGEYRERELKKLGV
tara:strand:- start:38912 stop:39136 length:225 start_codon:yes stop_codon:yes gene_type:complete